ncbi:hypothetical protein LCGC14_2020190, partial [marine sediment metagenome]
MESKAKQGEKNRAAGARFERKVRADLEVKGWTVSRWGNNVAIVGSKNPFEWEGMGKLVPAKSTRFRSNTHGFPDFIVFRIPFLKDNQKKIMEKDVKLGLFGPWLREHLYNIWGIEVKSNGYLDKT